MKQFMYVLKLVDPELQRSPDAWTAEQNEIVSVHFKYLQNLHEKGSLILAGRSTHPESGFGIAIFSAIDLDAAKKVMKSDPAVIAGLMEAQLHPFGVALKN